MIERRLLVGVGSPHSDDQLGWIVARRVALAAPPELEALCLAAPIDLVHALDAAHPIARLDICDAVFDFGRPGEVHQWSWPDARIAKLAFSGSHDLPLTAALELAATLGRLPATVQIWGVTGASRTPFGDVTPAVAKAAAQLASHWSSVATGA